jgi:hypothetical protein
MRLALEGRHAFAEHAEIGLLVGDGLALAGDQTRQTSRGM